MVCAENAHSSQFRLSLRSDSLLSTLERFRVFLCVCRFFVTSKYRISIRINNHINEIWLLFVQLRSWDRYALRLCLCAALYETMAGWLYLVSRARRATRAHSPIHRTKYFQSFIRELIHMCGCEVVRILWVDDMHHLSFRVCATNGYTMHRTLETMCVISNSKCCSRRDLSRILKCTHTHTLAHKHPAIFTRRLILDWVTQFFSLIALPFKRIWQDRRSRPCAAHNMISFIFPLKRIYCIFRLAEKNSRHFVMNLYVLKSIQPTERKKNKYCVVAVAPPCPASIALRHPEIDKQSPAIECSARCNRGRLGIGAIGKQITFGRYKCDLWSMCVYSSVKLADDDGATAHLSSACAIRCRRIHCILNNFNNLLVNYLCSQLDLFWFSGLFKWPLAACAQFELKQSNRCEEHSPTGVNRILNSDHRSKEMRRNLRRHFEQNMHPQWYTSQYPVAIASNYDRESALSGTPKIIIK